MQHETRPACAGAALTATGAKSTSPSTCRRRACRAGGRAAATGGPARTRSSRARGGSRPNAAARRVVAVAFADGLFLRFERRAAVDHRTLLRRPCADARAERARREIAVTFFCAGFLDPAFDAHLALGRSSRTAARPLGARQDRALAAFVIGEEDEPAFVDALDEHDACRRPAVGADGRERHRVRLGSLAASASLNQRSNWAKGRGRRRPRRAKHVSN